MTQVFLTVFNLSIAACWLIAAVLLVRLLFGKRMPKWMNHGFNSNSMTARGVKCPYCGGKLTITRWTDKLNVLPMYFD